MIGKGVPLKHLLVWITGGLLGLEVYALCALVLAGSSQAAPPLPRGRQVMRMVTSEVRKAQAFGCHKPSRRYCEPSVIGKRQLLTIIWRYSLP